jgi:hypothetical protein
MISVAISHRCGAYRAQQHIFGEEFQLLAYVKPF